MKWLFWASVFVVVYTYFGYPAWLWLRRKWKSNPVQRASILPSVSIVMVVRNEAAVLDRKLRNLIALNYPAELCEVVIVSDGSSDATAQILEQNASTRIRVAVLPEACGKAAGLNEAVKIAGNDI